MKLSIEKRGAPRGAKPILEIDSNDPLASAPVEPAAEPIATDDPEQRRTVLEWARAKGHVPGPRKTGFSGDIHRGMHVRVVMRHMRWPANLYVTQAEYDAAAKGAGDVACGENLSEQREKRRLANERAAAQRAAEEG
jgi:hypothetical protein